MITDVLLDVRREIEQYMHEEPDAYKDVKSDVQILLKQINKVLKKLNPQFRGTYDYKRYQFRGEMWKP